MDDPKKGPAVPKTLLELCQLQARQVAFTLYGMEQSLLDHAHGSAEPLTPDEQRLITFIKKARDHSYEAQTAMGAALDLFEVVGK